MGASPRWLASYRSIASPHLAYLALTLNATPTPKASPVPLPGLAAFLEPLMPLFRRTTTRESFERYCTGLLTDLPHKTCDGIAAAVAATTTERLQHLLTDADWDALALDRERVRQMIEASPTGGVLALDDTAFPKQGAHSVGVARQYCGELGKQANCQTIVTAEYIAGDLNSIPALHWPVSARLFLPDDWVKDKARRRRAHVPPEVQKESKPEIALRLIDRATLWEVPFRLVTADAAYGHFRDFFEGLEARRLLYACAVKCNFGVRRPEEVQAAEKAPPPPRKGIFGRKPKRHPAPLYRADEVVADLPEGAWKTITWRKGSKGPMRRQFTALRMHWGKGNQTRSLDDHRTKTSAEGWLIGERALPKKKGDVGETRYYFSNLPAKTTLKEIAMAVRSRWPIEQFYEDGKQLCGLGDYQGRSWDGLHRHVALVMLSYSFLALTRWQSQVSSKAMPTLPEVHRQVLLALLTDLVQHWALVKQHLLPNPFVSLLDRAPPDPLLTK